jgi:hypothetical protein
MEEDRTVSVYGDGNALNYDEFDLAGLNLTQEQKESLLEKCNSLEDIIKIIDVIRDLPEIITLEKISKLWNKCYEEPINTKKSSIKSWKKKRFYE